MSNETAPLSAVRVEPVVGRLTALDQACYANEEAEKELAQLRADASRYRWLRNNPEWLGWEHDFQPDEVEREVDAAMMTAPNAGAKRHE